MFLFHLYIYIFGCKFEVWRKKTHLILFQVGFFFNIYKFYFFLFFTLYLVSSFLEIFFLLKLFHCISLSLFHLFPFLFYSFCVFTFFLVYVCFMILFFLFLFCLSSFLSIFMYLCIYLFILFQKDSSFFNMFYNEKKFFKKLYFCLIRCRSPGFPEGFL